MFSLLAQKLFAQQFQHPPVLFQNTISNCHSLPPEIIPLTTFKVDSHVTSAFSFFFDHCRPILENVNVKSEHSHLLPQNPPWTLDANADVACEQGLRIIFKNCLLRLSSPLSYAASFYDWRLRNNEIYLNPKQGRTDISPAYFFNTFTLYVRFITPW